MLSEEDRTAETKPFAELESSLAFDFEDAVKRFIWYQSLDQELAGFVTAVEDWLLDPDADDTFDVSKESFVTKGGLEIEVSSDFGFVLQMIISRFGNYGSSPRYGWLEKYDSSDVQRLVDLLGLFKGWLQEWQDLI